MTTPQGMLAPCPFCGEAASIAQFGTSLQSCTVICTECGCRHESGDVGENSGQSWNARQAAAPQGREALIEQVAQWLHDETDDPDSFPGRAWPLHPNDTGRRSSDGWVHIVPIDVVEEFRATATRLVARFGAVLTPAVAPEQKMEMLISPDWLREKIETDPDLDTEVRPAVAPDGAAKWTNRPACSFPEMGSVAPDGAGEVTTVNDLPLFWQLRANALRILDSERGVPDEGTLGEADGYIECAKELHAALAQAQEPGEAVEYPILFGGVPECLRQLGSRLADLLDADNWNNIEPLLIEIARNLPPPQVDSGREEIARIIDPKAFVIVNSQRLEITQRKTDALAKADAILALRGGRVA